MGEKDERGKALFANVEWVWVSFCKIPLFPSYPSDINRTSYIAGWQAHHHHQLYFLYIIITSKMPVRCMEDQDLVGEKDERGKSLSANVERSVGKLS